MDENNFCSKNLERIKYFKLVILFLGLFFREVNSQPPENVTMDMTKLDHSESETLHVGDTVTVRLDIGFPIGVTRNVLIELAPSINGTVMTMGQTDDWDEKLTINPLKLGFSYFDRMSTRITPDMDADKGVVYRDKFSLDIGDVTVQSDATLEESTFGIEYEMVVVNVDNLESEYHWASAGVEYDDGMFIWVGQVAYPVSADDLATPHEAEYSVEEFSEMSIGTTHFFAVTLFVPNPQGLIAVEGIVQNDTSDLSVVRMMVDDSGENYKYCLDYDVLQAEEFTCPQGIGARSLRLEMPGITNKGSRADPYIKDKSKIVVGIAVRMIDDVSLIGQDYSLGVGVSIKDEIWVSQMTVTATANGAPVTGYSGLSVEARGDTNIPIGHPAQAIVKLVTNAKASDSFIIKIMSRGQASDTALRVSRVNVLKAGANIPCTSEFIDVVYSKTSGDIIDTAVTEILVENNDVRTNEEANTLELHVTLVAVDGIAPENSKHDVVAIIGNDESSPVTFTLVATQPYDTGIEYEINLYNECNSTCVLSGGAMEYEIEVITVEDKVTGPMTFEFPLPSNASVYMFTICDYKTTFVGRNVGCLNDKSLTIVDEKSDADGIHSLRFQVIPMCNLNLWPLEEDNKFTFAIKLRLRDIPTNLGATVLDWAAFGIQYSTDTLWVGQYKITVFGPETYSDLMLLEGLVVESEQLNSTWQGNFLVQSSSDGETYANLSTDDSSWYADTGNETYDMYMLTKPVLAIHARLTSTPCVTQCAPNYEMVVSDASDLLEIDRDYDSTLRKNTVLLQDGDPLSCFNLPKVGETPPVYWLRANTSLFGLNAEAYDLSVTGKGLNCQRHGTPLIQVSYPTTSGSDGFHGELAFCDEGSPSDEQDTTTCSFTCDCPDAAQCSELFIYIAKTEDDATNPWELCEITGTNV